MAKKVSNQDIIKMNELYQQYRTYAEVARQTGFSATTVKRYIDPNFSSFDSSKEKHFTLDMLPPIDVSRFRGVDNFGALCIMSTEELYEVRELWEEIH